jgi:TonB-linked SusC/RagA family outer membrane protein
MKYKNDFLHLAGKLKFYLEFMGFAILLGLVVSISGFAETGRNKKTGEVQQPAVQVSGTVKDAAGETLPGVNVVQKGTANGTVTNIDGYYTLRIPDNATLVFSFMGYASREITVGDQRTIDISLTEDTKLIEEIVVVGYGKSKKESIVGAVGSTTGEEMRVGNVTDLKQALTGLIPGVTTSISTGEPGGFGDGSSATSIWIRGRNSWNNSQPLIIVDNVERSMDNLDFSEVESVSVLKDASATAVFGVKGANGVILITTKRGKTAKPKLSFEYNATALMISKLPDKLDSYDVLRLRNESIEREISRNSSLWADYTPQEILRRYRERDYPEYEWLYPNVNWTEAMFKNVGWSHRAALNVNGGTNFVKYFGSLSYLHEGDMFKEYENNKGYDPNYDFDRFNFRTNFDFNITKSTLVRLNLSGFYSQKNTNYSYQSTGSGNTPMIWAAAYSMPPDVFLPQYEDGSWGQQEGFPYEQMQNPIAYIYNLGIWHRKTTALNADVSLEQKLDFITRGLSITGSFFYDNNIQTLSGINDMTNHVRPSGGNTLGKYVHPDQYTSPGQDMSTYTETNPVNPSSEFDWIVQPWNLFSEAISSSWTGYVPITRRTMYQLQINYNRRFADLHNVGAMGLFKREEYARGDMFPTYREDWVFRVTYDYDSRYFFEGNGAYNGSEKFSSDYRFYFFPSMAVGWYLSNEKFFNIEWMNRLKFRYSLGWVGDDSAGARWLYQAQYSYGGVSQLEQNPGSGSAYNYYRETVVPNPNARWEKARKNNFGIEMGFLNDLITVNYDYYTEHRTDIMIGSGDQAIPPYFGTDAPAVNKGEVKARGHELEVRYNGRTSFGLDYWAATSLTRTRNEVISRDDPQLQSEYLKAQGYPVGQTRTQIRADFYRNWDDIYASIPQQTNDQNKIPGYYDIVDFNGDGVITSDDAAPYGYPEAPENTYNLTLGAKYKGFSLMLQFYGVTNVTRNVPSNNYNLDLNILYAHAADYWSKDNAYASSFLPRWKTPGSTFIGDYYYFDGSYIRLKTAEFAYNLPKSMLDKLGGIDDVKLFVNGTNLWLWTKMPDDRENNFSGGSATQGAYPTTRRINFGINVTF